MPSHEVQQEEIPKTSETKFLELFDDLRDFALSINSFREIVKAKTWYWRLVWTIFGLSVLGICLSEIGNLFQRLIDQPTATKTEFFTNETLTFPVIKSMNISDDLLSYMLSAFKGLYFFYNEGGNQRHQVGQMEREYQIFLDTQPYDFSLNRFFIEYGTHCDKVLSACMFQGDDFECCDSSHMKEVLTDIGKCFVIKPPTDGQTIPGAIGGLKIYISNWGETYPETIINNNPDEGMQIHLSHPDEEVTTSSNPIIVFPGTHAVIEMSVVRQILKQVFDHQDNPSCTYDKELKYYKMYTMESCYAECVAKMTLSRCGCVQIGTVPISEALNESEFCEPKDSTNCVQPLLQETNSSFLWDIFDYKTFCGTCPLRCERWYYQNTVSYSTVANPGFEEAWKQPQIWMREANSTASVDTEAFVILDIYFNNLIYSTTDEQPVFGFNTFISNTGGQLSVWLGIRLVTVIQVLYYLITAFILIIPYAFRRLLDRYELRKPSAGSITQFRPPPTLFPTASLSVFQRGVLAPSTILHPNHPEIMKSRSSIFAGSLANGQAMHGPEGSGRPDVNNKPGEEAGVRRKSGVVQLRVVEFALDDDSERDFQEVRSTKSSRSRDYDA